MIPISNNSILAGLRHQYTSREFSWSEDYESMNSMNYGFRVAVICNKHEAEVNNAHDPGEHS